MRGSRLERPYVLNIRWPFRVMSPPHAELGVPFHEAQANNCLKAEAKTSGLSDYMTTTEYLGLLYTTCPLNILPCTS
jgi:hypothetical protein